MIIPRWSLPEQTTTRAPVFTGRSFCERQLGVRFILLVPQLATTLFSKIKLLFGQTKA